MATGAGDDPAVTAVLSALAGVRRGYRVAVLAAGGLTARALGAASGQDLVDPKTAEPGCCDVVAVGLPGELATGRRLLRSGGRLVALADDEQTARVAAGDLGLVVRHTEMLSGLCAWSAHAPQD